VIVLEGDLYTPRALFRQAFQTGIPALWQSRVLARYLVRDRGHRRVVVVQTRGKDAASSRDAFEDALRAEGVAPEVVSLDRGAPGAIEASGAHAVVFVGPAEEAAEVAIEISALPDPPQLALSAESLRADFPAELPPGTVAVGTYAWAAWADPIPRVGRFRERFEAEHGRLPTGLEQEGYDAVRLLAEGLEAAGGRTGEPLVRRLERNRPEGPTFSALPLVLGPDDHTLTDETFVGLWAVAGPEEGVEPWVEGTPWRPIIRTFTSDGERTLFLERDRRVFFPFWRKDRPSPKFGRSRLGIVTGRRDPLH
jgi:ABC-type branched-subunit amino acid transport system substrate-binding protein